MKLHQIKLTQFIFPYLFQVNKHDTSNLALDLTNFANAGQSLQSLSREDPEEHATLLARIYQKGGDTC